MVESNDANHMASSGALFISRSMDFVCLRILPVHATGGTPYSAEARFFETAPALKELRTRGGRLPQERRLGGARDVRAHK
jgi:hypothetical protein